MSALGPAEELSRERILLEWRPFSFSLQAPLLTAAGVLVQRSGWLLRLETGRGAIGWGEATPLLFGDASATRLHTCAQAIRQLGSSLSRGELERQLPDLPPPMAFALGAALAEADGLVGPGDPEGWRPAPPSAWLLPAGEEALRTARRLMGLQPSSSFKWKMGVCPLEKELAWFSELAAGLPPGGRLRLDANGGLDRAAAGRWADHLAGDGRLDWLEQPLDPADQEGLEALARRLPVALDESLRVRPELRNSWRGWQVRRPSQEGDPRPLLRELRQGRPWLMVSSSFETGIGRRWLAHLAALQAEGPTPAAPGLAPGWEAPGELGSPQPERVWQAAMAG